MKYSFDSRIRYSETGLNQKLTLLSLVDYFQDCSTFHSESCGLGLHFLQERSRAWMVVYWQIDLVRLPSLCDFVTVHTWPYEFKGIYGMRNFALSDGQGEYLAKANSVWVMIDMKNGTPCRIRPEEISGYGQEEKLDMEYLPRKIAVPEHYEEKESITVSRHHLDTNDHVNNGQYIGMAEEYLPEDFPLSRIRVEYRSQAHLGDVIVPRVTREPEEITVTLCSPEGKIYSIVAFSKDT